MYMCTWSSRMCDGWFQETRKVRKVVSKVKRTYLYSFWKLLPDDRVSLEFWRNENNILIFSPISAFSDRKTNNNNKRVYINYKYKYMTRCTMYRRVYAKVHINAYSYTSGDESAPLFALVEVLIPCPSPPRLYHPRRVAYTCVCVCACTERYQLYIILSPDVCRIIAGGKKIPLDDVIRANYVYSKRVL